MKISRSHSTHTETSKTVIDLLEKTKLVQKISRGIIKNTRSKSGQKSLKITDLNTCLKVSVRGNGAVQDLYVYTKKPEEIKIELNKLF